MDWRKLVRSKMAVGGMRADGRAETNGKKISNPV